LAIRALAHFEIKQALRDFRYGRDAFANVVAQLAALAAIYPAALGFRDYRAMVLSLMIEAIVYVAASHLLAQLRYSATSSERKILRQALAFGLPLTLNGLGLAMLSQFDRALVSHWLGIQTLALYAVILSLAAVPISLIFRIVSPLGWSLLVRARRCGGIETDAFPFMVWVFAVLGAAYAIFVAATLDFLVPLIYGSRYTVSPFIHMLMTMIVWFRLQRGGAPTGLILVSGDTRWLMMGNLVGGAGLVLGGVFLIVLPRLDIFLIGVLFGDVISFAALFWATHRLINGRSSMTLEQVLWSFAAMSMASFCVSPLLAQALPWRYAILSVASLIVVTQVVYGFQSRLVYRALQK
jgi:O-antigen/teichoic acid export membrane protein